LPPGTAIFQDTKGRKPLGDLRALLKCLGIADAMKYRTHDLRRGHTQDIADGGSPMKEILKEGQWCAARSYLDFSKIEDRAVAETHAVSSSDEDDPDLSDESA